MHPVAVVFGKDLGESGFQLLRRLLGADGLLAARMRIDFGEDVRQRNVLAFVNIEISVRELTFDDAEAFIRLPSSSDSTITPLVDCATYL